MVSSTICAYLCSVAGQGRRASSCPPRPYPFPLKSNILEHDLLELCAPIPKLRVHWILMMFLLCGLGTSQEWAGTVGQPLFLCCASKITTLWWSPSGIKTQWYVHLHFISSSWWEVSGLSCWVTGGDASGTSYGLKSFPPWDNSRRWGLWNMMKLWCHNRHSHN